MIDCTCLEQLLKGMKQKDIIYKQEEEKVDHKIILWHGRAKLVYRINGTNRTQHVVDLTQLCLLLH